MGGAVLENSLKVVKDGGTIVSLPTHEFPEELRPLLNLSNLWIKKSSSQSSMGNKHEGVTLFTIFKSKDGIREQIIEY